MPDPRLVEPACHIQTAQSSSLALIGQTSPSFWNRLAESE